MNETRKIQKAPVFTSLNKRIMISSKHYSRKQLTDVIRKIDRTINFTRKTTCNDEGKTIWYFYKPDRRYLVSIKLDKYGLWCYYNITKDHGKTIKFGEFLKNEREFQAFINQLKKHLY